MQLLKYAIGASGMSIKLTWMGALTIPTTSFQENGTFLIKRSNKKVFQSTIYGNYISMY